MFKNIPRIPKILNLKIQKRNLKLNMKINIFKLCFKFYKLFHIEIILINYGLFSHLRKFTKKYGIINTEFLGGSLQFKRNLQVKRGLFFFVPNVWPFSFILWLKVCLKMFSFLDVVLELEHFTQTRNIVHSQRFFGMSYRLLIVFFFFVCSF